MAIPVIESVVRLVEWSRQHAAPVVLLAVVMTGVLGFYAAGNLGIDTDSEKLLSDELLWRQREIHFDALFPQNTNLLAVVVDGETVGVSEKATATLADWMRAHPELFKNVRRPDGGPFFDKNGLLYLKSDELQSMSDQLITAQPLIGTLAADPSLRGLFNVLGLALDGVAHGDANLADLEKPVAAVAEATESVLAGHPQPLAWQVLLTGRKPSQQELRRFILAQPTLDYGDLRPGGRASDALRAAARNLGFTADHGVRVRLTGPVALSEEEFASVAKGTGLAMVLSCTLVCLILFVAVRSLRVIAAILVTLIIGLVWTAAYAAAVVHTLNLLSVAFAVLFVGIAVDFSIQFSVRYRDERYRTGDFAEALARTARRVGGPLLLAAASTAAGFLSFIPTAYRGLSELGLIAGSSMLIAIFLNLTVLPAILTLLRPKGERAPVGFVWAAPIDGILLRRRGLVMFLAGLLAVACLVAAPRLHFDFNPLHLKDPHTESMATLLDLMADPLTTPFTVETLTPQPDAAARLGKQLEQLPEVAQAVSIESYVPDDQEAKLAILSDLNLLLGPTLSPPTAMPPPNDQDVLASIRRTIEKLDATSGGLPPEAPTRRLRRALAGVIANPDKIAPLDASLIGGLEDQLDNLRTALSAGPVTLADLPADLKRDWVADDGEARIEIFPKAGGLDDAAIRHFVDAVRAIVPDAGGAAVSIVESSRTIVNAFLTAGALAFAAIALLLFAVLRRLRDVLLVMAPLVLAALLTIATMVAIGLSINFANIIALPLLFGIGVAFDIYFVMNWRAGLAAPLASATTRAVLFSALTTTATFGSLALSSHPGTSGMGVLLTIALFYTLLSTLFFLPALLGPPAVSAGSTQQPSTPNILPNQQRRNEHARS